MRVLMYRPSWQALRVSFLKENNSSGGWTTLEGTRDNLLKLDQYVTCKGLGQAQAAIDDARAMGYDTSNEYAARLFRAINCLNACRMGYSGQGLKDTDIDKAVRDYRDYLQTLQTVNYHKYLTNASKKWKWEVVAKELEFFYVTSLLTFNEIEANLTKRLATNPGRDRPELEQFVRLMKGTRSGD